MTPRWSAAVLLPGLVTIACSSASPVIPVDPARPAALASAVPARPARWLVPEGDFVERTEDGLDHVVAGGRRLALRGLAVVESAPRSPEVQGGAVAPPWAGAGPQRYVFWKGRTLYGAASFTGELHLIASLPAEPRGSFDWIGGVGLLLAGGAAVIAPGSSSLALLPIPAASHGFAADARRALAVDVLGRAALTLDGGATFRDVTSELGTAPRVELRGDALALTLRDGRERFILPSGEIVSSYSARGRDRDRDRDRDRARRPDPDAGAWPRAAGRSVLDAAVTAGLPLPDGGAVIVGRGFVGRLDLTTLRATSVTPIPAAATAECAPIRQGSAVLLACSDRSRAMIVDVTGTPRIERTFDFPAARSRDRFTGSDDGGLGFLGPCEPTSPTSPTAAALPEDAAASPGRSAVFCARASRDTWIEHRVDRADAAHLFAWIARPGGGAVALVALPGAFVSDPDRVEVRGALRIVRIARRSPPLSLPLHASRSGTVLDRAFRAGADSVLEGWLPTSSAATGQVAVTIDPRGRVRAYPAPLRAQPIRAAGAFALVATDDDQLFETTDRGHTWVSVEPPPGEPSPLDAQCSAVGCRAGTFVRLGWSGAEAAAPPAAAPRPSAPSSSSRPPPPALVALRCRFDGPATGLRSTETSGFGVTSAPPVRGQGPIRLGQQGTVQMTWSGPPAPAQGDAEIAWIPPLDPTAPIRRVTLALAASGLALPSQRPYDARLGYLLDLRGGLELFPVGRRETCLDSVLDRAGVTRSLGGCAGDLAVGVELADRVILAQPSLDSVVVSSAPSPSRSGSLRELARVPAAMTRGFSFGAGARGGAPVLVAVDVLGEALLAPIDPVSGTLGPSERLRSLTALALGKDPSCKGPIPAAEARVALPFDSSIGLDRGSLPGVLSVGPGGVAVIRWSKERACLDAVEIPVRDERYDPDLGPHDPPGSVRKLIARFDAERAGKGKAPREDGRAGLVLISGGSEIRQPITCDGIAPTAPARP